jgi:RecB family exonuclease
MSEQLGFDGMPERLYAATPTRLGTWQDCPRRYRMTYLDRPTPTRNGAWAHTSLGTAVHQGLADWWLLTASERTASAAAQAVRARWRPEGFRDDAQSERWRETAAQETGRYVVTQDAARAPVGVERTVSAHTERLVLSGRIDRLDDRDGELVVVDYKTSRRPLGADAARDSLALAVYALAAGEVYRRPCLAVELHHVPTGKVVRHVFTPELLQHRITEADAIGAELARVDAAHQVGTSSDADFAPRPGPRCGWCDLRSHCPQGQAAGPARRPWAALEPDG